MTINGVNDSSTTCNIKFSDKHFTYLQSVANINDKDINIVEVDYIIIGESMVYSSPETLEGIYKKSIPLYSLIMSKRNKSIGLVATDKQKNRNLKSRRNSILYFLFFFTLFYFVFTNDISQNIFRLQYIFL